MNRINVLSEDTANKIAAGEIVEGPLSVVKELVENSIDAGSTSIEIELKSGGKKLIRVSDDGSGMSRDDAVLALERHSTSKISDPDDLESITTMGFRGEAIPSIASVSQLTISTCEQESSIGTFVNVDGGKLVNVVDTGRPPGTTVEVKNLFYYVPARRKYMRSIERETANILATVQNYAVANIHIHFRVIHNNKALLLAPKAENIKDRIATIFGKNYLDQMIMIADYEGELVVSGLISKPSFTRSNRASQLFFVNHRPVKSLPVSYAVAAGYRTMLPNGRHPVYVLFLDIDPTQIDVNVHPTKREVRFRNQWQLRNTITNVVSETLGMQKLAPVAKFPNAEETRTPEPEPELPGATEFEKNLARATERAFQFTPVEQSSQRIETPEKPAPPPEPGPELPVETPPESGGPQKYMRFLAQLKNSYILAEDDKGLVIIDQHAAHERVLFEKLNGNAPIGSQRLLVAETLEFSPAESVILEDSKEILRKVGFEIRPFGKNTFIIDAVPVYLKSRDVTQTLNNLLDNINDYRSDYKTQREATIIRSACRAAVMAKDSLDPEECDRLLKDLALCEYPYTCPHGRPTIITMPMDQLEKEFKRK